MEILEKRYKKHPNIVSREIGDEFILVPIRRNVGDLESIYTLDKVAARIWELVDGKRKVKEITDKITEEYKVTPEKAEKDVVQFIMQLKKIDSIKE